MKLIYFRPIKLVVAKCWEQTPSRGYLSMPRQEPVRPIDPGAWVAHTAAVRGKSQCLNVLANFPCMAGESKSFIHRYRDYG